MGDTSYTDSLGNIPNMSDEELDALSTQVQAAFDAADQADDLEGMSQAADTLDQIKEAQDSRAGGDNVADLIDDGGSDAVASEAPVAASAETETAPDAEGVTAGGDTSTGSEIEEEAPNPSADAEDSGPEDLSAAPAPEETPPDDEEQPMTASAATETTTTQEPKVDVEIPEDRKPVATVSEVAITAGADIPQYSMGSLFETKKDVAQAFINRLQGMRNAVGADGEQLIVASIANKVDESRFLVAGDAEGNQEKIRAVTSKEALTASGGYCAPLEVKYDIFGLGTTARPVRDSLAGFQADRGGIRYVTPPKLGDLAGAIALWTAANDANPTSPTTKPCLTVTCAPENTVSVDAITLCLQFGNLMTRAYPELVNRNNELALVQQARFAETQLLTKLTSLSTAVSSTQLYGTTRDGLSAVARAAANYRARHRMDPDEIIRAIVPAWVRDEIREDVATSFNGDYAVADAVIASWFTERNIAITWTIDEGFQTAQVAGGLNAWPTSFRFWLFAEGTFLFLDGGTLDIGLVRDSTLVGTNDYKMFTENFETVAKVGIEGLVCTVNTTIAGLVGGQAHAGATP